jgi:hypothetical protein
MNYKNQALTMCKCNADDRSFPAFAHCLATANPALTDVGYENMFNKKPAWLRAALNGKPFNSPHYTCTNR